MKVDLINMTKRIAVEAQGAQHDQFNKFFHGMLSRGVYLAPSSFEAGFISCTHSENDIADTIDIAAQVMQEL